MDDTTKLLEIINLCLLPKLGKNFDERENHPEFENRNNTLHKNIQHLEQALIHFTLNDKKAAHVISALLILYLELNSNSVWNNVKCKEMSKKINSNVALLTGLSLEHILHKHQVGIVQEIFDICIETLHKNLTYADFKKYPGQIDAYCLLVKDLKKTKADIKPQQMLPASLLLIDDYNVVSKQKGLESCLSILQCLTCNDFKEGNYYEVIYIPLAKLLYEKDIEITKLNHSCLLELCNILPLEVKEKKLDELYSNALEQISIDSNLYRKAEYLKFLKSIILMHKTNSIKRSNFKIIICDCLDICTESAVAEIILEKTLQCLEIWVQYCWCVWYFTSDHKIISSLFKTLYVCKDEDLLKSIRKILSTLCNLCNSHERQQILLSMEQNGCVFSEDFRRNLEIIKNELNI